MSAMQHLGDSDYGREMRCVTEAREAVELARAAIDRAYMKCATKESENFYEELEILLKDALKDLAGHEEKIFEASQPQHASFYEVKEDA